jgi:acylphosphatase
MNCKRLTISGRVQGVGYREWMVRTARDLGVSGWVRNRLGGSVEALVAGDIAAVEELSRLCRRGPRMAQVVSIEEELADPPESFGFRQVPSA